MFVTGLKFCSKLFLIFNGFLGDVKLVIVSHHVCSYHKHAYGLGEHYNSVLPKED